MNESELTEHLEVLGGLLDSDMVSDEAMSLSELDGFMAGVIVSPISVLPSEWIVHVWGEDGIKVDDADEVRAMNGFVMGHFKQLLFGLYQGFVHPIFDFDAEERPDWGAWLKGFVRAMDLRPDARQMYGSHDGGLGGEDAEDAIYTLIRLNELSKLPEDQLGEDMLDEEDAQMLSMAPDLIAEAVLLLYGVKQESGVRIPVSLADTGDKAGRNDPCPCGSGKTYAECCLPKDQERLLEEARRAESLGPS